MNKIAAAFRELARVVNLNGRRLLRAELQQTWIIYPPGSAWERRDGSVACTAARSPNGSRRDRLAQRATVRRSIRRMLRERKRAEGAA